eukprot:SAG31_NODE_1786_length_7271_cov_6.872492_2_plen_63_part_00
MCKLFMLTRLRRNAWRQQLVDMPEKQLRIIARRYQTEFSAVVAVDVYAPLLLTLHIFRRWKF